MKKGVNKVVVWAFVIAATLVVVLYIFGIQSQSKSYQGKAEDTNGRVLDTELDNTPNDQNPRKNGAYDKARMDKLIAFMRHEDAPIKFYGIVVDQDETPLANAKVDWRIGKPTPPDVRGTAFTDQQGLFAISGETGRALSIETITKDGYREANSSYYGYSFGSVPEGRHVPNPKQPELFILVSNELPKVKRVKTKKFPLVWNADLNRIPLGLNDLEVLVRATRDKKPGQVNGISWKVEFSMPSANLKEMDVADAPLASADGYQNVFSLYRDAADRNRHVNIENRTLFFKTDSGLFGKIKFSIAPESDKNALMITTYLNDYGKRNLE